MFTPDDRLIYRYSNGEQDLFGDPLAIKRSLIQLAGGDLPGLIEKAVPPDELNNQENPAAAAMRIDAEEKLVEIIRKAFQLPKVDPKTGSGVTDSMVWRVWDDFSEFLLGEKKREG
jgi:hypothetical protein